MALFTIYLAQLKGENLEDRGLKEPKIYYVMLNRGNNEVAPEEKFLKSYKKMWKIYTSKEDRKELWEQYEEGYHTQIGLSHKARDWMKRVAEESLFRDVILVCFEKDHIHCHRYLLANEIVRRHPEVNYVGELNLKGVTVSSNSR